MTVYKQVEFVKGWPSLLRFSNVIAKLKQHEDLATAKSTILLLSDLYEKVGNTCSSHGHLDDPVIMIATVNGEEQLAFVCPHCSDENIRQAWQDEKPIE